MTTVNRRIVLRNARDAHNKPKSKPVPVSTLPYHYFGSTALNWATGGTRDEVIKKLAKEAGAAFIKRTRTGMYCWTCRVDLPSSATYEIRNYAPWNVPISDQKAVDILNVHGVWVENTEAGDEGTI